MEGREFKGKSVDEAIFNGLQAMGLSLDEVEIEVLQEGTKGFLGFGKSALVRLTEREEPVVAEAEPEEEPREQRRRRDSGRQRRRDSRSDTSNTYEERRDTYVDRQNIHEEETAETPAEPVYEKLEEETQEVVSTPAEPVETEESRRAQDFLNGLFKKMNLDAQCALAAGSDPENLRIDIEGSDTAVLIGRRGDTLDALQYLTGLVINKDHDEYIRVMLDAEGYRDKRVQTLQKLAKRLANNVMRSGKPIKLEPMNPYERRILHATLQSHPSVETFSEGVDPYRRVVIRKKRGTGGGQNRGGSYEGRRRKPRQPRNREHEN